MIAPIGNLKGTSESSPPSEEKGLEFSTLRLLPSGVRNQDQKWTQACNLLHP
jgi:hypothetical protein